MRLGHVYSKGSGMFQKKRKDRETEAERYVGEETPGETKE